MDDDASAGTWSIYCILPSFILSIITAGYTEQWMRVVDDDDKFLQIIVQFLYVCFIHKKVYVAATLLRRVVALTLLRRSIVLRIQNITKDDWRVINLCCILNNTQYNWGCSCRLSRMESHLTKSWHLLWVFKTTWRCHWFMSAHYSYLVWREHMPFIPTPDT